MVQLGVNCESDFSSSLYGLVPVNYRFPCLIPPHRIQRQVAAQHAQVLAQQYAAQLLQFNNMGGGLVSRRRPTHAHNQVGAPTTSQNNNHSSHTHPPPVVSDANPTTTSPLDSSLSTLPTHQQQPSPLLSTSDHLNIVSAPATPLSSVQSPSTQVLAAAPSSSYPSESLLSSPAPSSGSLSSGLTVIDEAPLLERIASSLSPISASLSSSSSSSSSSLSLSSSSSSSSGCSSSVSRSLVSVSERSDESGSGSVGAIRHTPRIREKRLAAQAQSTRRPKLQLPRDNQVLSTLSLSSTAPASSDVLPISVCDASASSGSVSVTTSSPSSGRTSSTIDGSIAQMFTPEMQIEGSDAGVSKSSRDDNNNNNDGNLSNSNSTAQRTATV